MSALPRALLLDLDDTLLRFAPDSELCWRDVCEVFAPRLGGVEPERLFAAIRRAADGFWNDPAHRDRGRLDLTSSRRAIVATALNALEIEAPDHGRRLADTFTRMREERVRPLPGAIEALARARGAGVRTALLTNGSAEFQRRKVERFQLAALFDAVFIEGEVGYGKPDERVFLRALEVLGVEPPDAWMVGDNFDADIVPAVRLGIEAIWVDVDDRGVPGGARVAPHRRVRSFAELVD